MNTMIKNSILGSLLAAVVSGAIAAAPAMAQDASFSDRAPDEWSFSVTPYLFLPVTTTGTSTVAGVSADIDLSLDDVFSALKFAGSLRAEVWRGDFGLMLDGYYVNLGGGTTATLPGPGAGTANVQISVKQAWGAALGAWRFAKGEIDGTEGLRYAIDAGVGFRYNSLRQTVSASVDLGPGPGLQTNLGGTESWFEPVIALRGGMEVAPDWTLGARAEIGGFGAGGNDLHWLVLLGADYAPWEQVSLKLGWQLYGIDFSTTRADGEFAYDVFQTGPYLGATFRF